MSDQRKADFYNGITIEENANTGKWDIIKDGKPIVLYSREATHFPSKAYAAEFLDDAFGDVLRENPIKLEGLDLKTGGEGMKGYYDKVYLKRVQEVIKKATGTKPEIEVIEVQTADGPRKQLGVKLTDEMREKARFSDFNQGGRVTGGNAYDNDKTVDSALALTREY